MICLMMENYFLKPGYIYVSQEQLVISTVLGSCVSLCLWDREKKYGGMNHFIYPKRGNGERSTKYGDVACRHLIRLMEELGSSTDDLTVHLIGGAQDPLVHSSIGSENIEAAKNVIEKYSLKPTTIDVGGEFGRKMAFNTATGEVIVYKCSRLRESDWHR